MRSYTNGTNYSEANMIKWNVYQSDKDYRNKKTMVLGTFELLWWLVFGHKQYIVTINKRKD